MCEVATAHGTGGSFPAVPVDGGTSGNAVAFGSAGLNQLVRVDYGPCSVTATANVFQVQSVVLLDRFGATLPTNPNPGGGLKIFPDKDNPSDPPELNRQVRVKATINPVTNNFPIYFKLFDVDDPSTNAAPVDANDTGGNPVGGDNRGTNNPAYFLATMNDTVSTNTDAMGVVEVVLRVTMQPGDNFRVAADCHTNDLYSLQVTNSAATATYVPSGGGTPTSFHVKLTDMLTVWRRLHVELDSMAEVTGNYKQGNITRIFGAGTKATKILVDTPLGDGSPDITAGTGKGRFENGTMTNGVPPSAAVTIGLLGNGTDFVRMAATTGFSIPFTITKGSLSPVTGNVVRFQGLTFDLNVTGGTLTTGYVGGTCTVVGVSMSISAVNPPPQKVTVASYVPIPFSLHDDDDDTLFNAPRFPNAGLLTNALSASYIVPKFDLGNTTPVAPFILNVGIADFEIVGAMQWDTTGYNADDFWVAYLLGAFQGDRLEDADPNAELTTYGISPALPLGGSLIFVEPQQSHEFPVHPPTFQEQIVAVHELGHTLGRNGAEPVTTCDTNVCPPGTVQYQPIYLDSIRTSKRPEP